MKSLFLLLVLSFPFVISGCEYEDVVWQTLSSFVPLYWQLPSQDYCTWTWVHCDDCKIKELNLSSQGLSGSLPSNINQLTHLRSLDLSHNNFIGRIPRKFLGMKQLRYVDLSWNSLEGPIPQEIFRSQSLRSFIVAGNNLSGFSSTYRGFPSSTLQTLDLSSNTFNSSIPGLLFDIPTLSTLNLSRNQFTGNLSKDIGKLSNLSALDVSHNNLSGPIPASLANRTNLNILDLSHNDFVGQLPARGIFCHPEKVNIENTELNFTDCNTQHGGENTPPVQSNGADTGIPSVRNNTGSPPNPNREKNTFRLPKAVLAALIAIVALFLFFPLFFFFCKRRYSGYRNLRGTRDNRELFTPTSIVPYASLETATRDFSASYLIGSGGVGSVYRGTLGHQERAAAVKVLNKETSVNYKRLVEECHELRNIQHGNIANLLASCEAVNPDGNRFSALVYELMPRGSLEMWLHEEEAPQILGFENWKLSFYQRLNMAIDVASALVHLHCKLEKPIVHCNLKSSNILIAEDMTALLVDVGMDRLFPIDVVISKSRGYAAPEYGMGNPMSPMSDVYSFGVLMLEMFTGKRPTVLFGAVFWRIGNTITQQQDIFNILGIVYGSALFLGFTNASMVQPIIGMERAVFYRERSAGMYTSIAYAVGQVAVEIPYIIIQLLIFSIIVYPTIGFQFGQLKFLWFMLFMLLSFIYFTLFGMMTVALTPTQEIAALFSFLIFILWNIFSGFFIPRKMMPTWWRWFYWADPAAWTIYGLMASQLGDHSEIISIPGMPDQTVREFLWDYFGIHENFLPLAAAVHVLFIVLFLFVFSFSIKYLNFQSK